MEPRRYAVRQLLPQLLTSELSVPRELGQPAGWVRLDRIKLGRNFPSFSELGCVVGLSSQVAKINFFVCYLAGQSSTR